MHNGKPWIYMCGNSLGLQPKSVADSLAHQLKQWQDLGVEGWFEGDRPWIAYAESLSLPTAEIVGALPDEITIMNTLTVNLHLLLASFYRPEGSRTKILMEKGAFPSDHHMIDSQLKWHGLEPKDHTIFVESTDEGISEDAICQAIEEHADAISLVFLGGVNYASGQVIDMERIATCCQKHVITLGLDLAHAAGNIHLALHDWGVDFAAWCTYKYLNSGPGGPSGIFVHNKHNDRQRLAGWWGHDEKTRFLMDDEHVPANGASGWQISTPQIMNYVGLSESLKIHSAVGMGRIDAKRRKMNAYFDFLLASLIDNGRELSVITPIHFDRRGAQISIQFHENGKAIFEKLKKEGIIGDWREPNIIRLSPAPLYNTYEEIHHIFTTLTRLL